MDRTVDVRVEATPLEATETLVTPKSPEESARLQERILDLKRVLGKRLLILGHHYQVDEIIRFADITGDSFKLAKDAASRHDADYAIMCGVHFMAESVDILAAPHQRVILPDLAAGCSMADMANLDQVEIAYAALGGDGVLPMTYMNSTAAIKAFCGRKGGAVCTSGNAKVAIPWALKQRPKLLFLPDQHLGRNISTTLGVRQDEMAIWDPMALPEDNLAKGCDRARIVLWKGHCSVHTKFLAAHVDIVRKRYPGIRVLAHPEVPYEVFSKADEHGSTERIISMVSNSKSGSQWAIGTEINLVNRLAKANPDKTVVSLSGINCLCSTMYRIDPPHLLWVLENLVEGRVVNEIVVDDATAKDARLALDRMLALVG